MADPVYNVLFLCTGNSARSIMAEALLNHLGKGRFNAFSAGSHPKGAVHPGAFETLRGWGIPTEGLRSKSWQEFAAPDAPPLDFVVTVCDNAAGEACPVWPGRPITAHWGVEDPAASTDLEDAGRQRFAKAGLALRARIERLLLLPLASLDRPAVRSKLQEIGQR